MHRQTVCTFFQQGLHGFAEHWVQQVWGYVIQALQSKASKRQLRMWDLQIWLGYNLVSKQKYVNINGTGTVFLLPDPAQ
jgi:hypothetical protein